MPATVEVEETKGEAVLPIMESTRVSLQAN